MFYTRTKPAQFAPIYGSAFQVNGIQLVEKLGKLWWAHQDSNLGPTDYESAALTAELWARKDLHVSSPLM